jgi:hypothetical protein
VRQAGPGRLVFRPEGDQHQDRQGADALDRQYAVLQEVKTTGANDLTHANRLIEDYIKLFGTDAEVTLQTRLGVAANHMETLNIESEICCRTTEMGGISPRDVFTCPTCSDTCTFESSFAVSLFHLPFFEHHLRLPNSISFRAINVKTQRGIASSSDIVAAASFLMRSVIAFVIRDGYFTAFLTVWIARRRL